ncbi:calcium release-activated calcium channel protein 1-like [Cylas formicarius]|uniref:calcium release-activated calcium channel protein 1-like n=1 Tax=Cylas formicarius TaxID=197179 RepID=UPI002958995C|nr:calcium release-activated calcium channel protein 1-like [Cylas formicarius]XP_060534216.1 calcium release-activated calcium channel protein 1-like [Cylas formicarius]XP_060534217.1 calcium release-activated calcium channel protein 1-like [Cylas formicarius]
MVDESTQVNFSTAGKNQHRKMKRHNTSSDLLYSQHLRTLSNSFAQLKPLSSRPRSLNIVEAFNKPKFIAHDAPLSLLSTPGMDTPLSSISRERTPPFSCNSSTVSNGALNFKLSTPPPVYVPSPKFKSLQDDESTASTARCCCRCYDVEMGCHGRKTVSNTREGLSWRRLHKSRAKLKATATTSELLSGFAMIAMVELQINTPTNVPEWLFVMFAVCTTVLVAVHIFALMISTYILPNIESIAKLEICELITESPHERMRGFIELAWAFSTILGLFLFMVEVAILCWVKFWDYSFTAAVAATVIVVPVLITFVLFAAHFYHSLVVDKCNASITDMKKLEEMKKHLDEVSQQAHM